MVDRTLDSPNQVSLQTNTRNGGTKRILQVFEPGVDGVFRHVEGLVDFLLGQKDWQVGIAYSSVRDSEGLYHLVERVKAAGGPAIDLRVGNAPGLSDCRALIQLRALVKAFRPQILHAHSSKAGGLARLPWAMPRTPTIYTPHAYYGMGPRKGLKSKLFDLIERGLASRGTSIHVSPEEAEFAREILRQSNPGETIIPNGVDIQRFCPPVDLAAKAKVKAEFGFPDGTWVLGSIGRLGFQKDPETLYHAFAILRQREPDRMIRLLHVCSGTAQDKENIKSLAVQLGIDNDIIYPSYRTNPHVFFHAMDAFCLTSRYEGMPLTAIEAIASGLPLVLANSPGLRCFGGASFGLDQVYFGDKENAPSMADAMRNGLLKRDTENNHRSMAVRHFSNEQCHGSILNIYRQVLRLPDE